MKPAEFRALRKRTGLSLERVAQYCGTSKRCVHYFESTPNAEPRWPVDKAARWMLKVDERRSAA